MPYCELVTTEKLSAAAEKSMNAELVRIIEQVPGKSKRWIMTRIDDGARMSFGGVSDKPAAIVCLKSFGRISDDVCDMLTADLCEAVSRIAGVPSDRIYVEYEPVEQWGWNGGNF